MVSIATSRSSLAIEIENVKRPRASVQHCTHCLQNPAQQYQYDRNQLSSFTTYRHGNRSSNHDCDSQWQWRRDQCGHLSVWGANAC